MTNNELVFHFLKAINPYKCAINKCVENTFINASEKIPE